MNRRSFLLMGAKGVVLGAAISFSMSTTKLAAVFSQAEPMEFTTGYREDMDISYLRGTGVFDNREWHDLVQKSGRVDQSGLEMMKSMAVSQFERFLHMQSGITV